MKRKNTGEKRCFGCDGRNVAWYRCGCGYFSGIQLLGGSMGSVVGEKFVQAIRFAIKEKIFYLFFIKWRSANAGGLVSLMQMAKTSSAVDQLKGKGIPFVS